MEQGKTKMRTLHARNHHQQSEKRDWRYQDWDYRRKNTWRTLEGRKHIVKKARSQRWESVNASLRCKGKFDLSIEKNVGD